MDVVPDPPLSPEQLSRIRQLSDGEVKLLDSQLLESCSDKWRKVARVVGETMASTANNIENVSDLYLAGRIYELVRSGALEHQGYLGHMRYCEVRKTTADS